MPESKRDLLDELTARAPVLSALSTATVARLKPGSELRRRMLDQAVRRGFAAMARSDLDLVLLTYEPDAEIWMRGMAAVGVDECYLGHDGVRRLYADVDEVFENWRWIIRGMVDGGATLAIRADFVGVGRGSGVRTELTDSGTAMRLSSRGRISWQEWFVEQDGWEKTLAASGLKPA
jgi:hypothetical protein